MSINLTTKQLRRFWKKVNKSADPDSCWEWNANKDKDNYGKIRINKRDFRAHRLSYLIHNGEIPKGLSVLHHCDNPSCVNPKHLFVGTGKDNMRDKISKGRQPAGEKHHAHKLTWNDVREIRKRYKWRSANNNMATLASDYGVSIGVIGKIINNQNWKVT